jgi:hypothetical protein
VCPNPTDPDRERVVHADDLRDSLAEPDEVHLACCDAAVALCGETLTGDITSWNATLTCVECVIADEARLPCGQRFCGVRSRARAVRWWFRSRVRSERV